MECMKFSGYTYKCRLCLAIEKTGNVLKAIIHENEADLYIPLSDLLLQQVR